jgi:TolB protein
MKERILRKATLIAIISLLWPSLAAAKVYLDINAPATRKLPLAIAIPAPLEGASPDPAISREVREVLAGDLAFSGVFRILDPLLYLEDEEHSGIRINTFLFDDWELINSEALIKVGYLVTPKGDVELEFHLFDVFQRRELVAKKWRGTAGQVRRMAHMFANEVIHQITGEEGVFLTSILYVQAESRGKEIFLMDYDGENTTRITRNGSINLSPSWWPGGTGLLYTSYKKGSPDLYSMSLKGSEKRLTRGLGVDVGAEISPDGRTIAFMGSRAGNPDIYLSDRDGGDLRRLTTLRSVDGSPVWSPDGRRIAFISDRYGTPQIFVMNADGTDVQRITYDGNYNTSPAWSPAGDLIAYTARVNGRFAIYLVNPDTLETRPLVGEAGDNEDPSWSPDGRHIAFASNRSGVYQIYLVDREGRREIRITSGRRDKFSPAWSLK